MKFVEALKINILAKGIGVSTDARNKLSDNGKKPLAVHEYTTTGGLNLLLENNIHVNAPFDEPFFEDPDATLDYDATSHTFFTSYRGNRVDTTIIPLPGYLNEVDSRGRPVTLSVFSHVDRVRVSPVYGCTMSCEFCDIPGHKYVKKPLEQLLEGLKIAQQDTTLPIYHILISGGTPGPKDYDYFDNVCAEIVAATKLPVDVMMPPRQRDPDFFVRLFDMGIHGLSINLEVFDDSQAKKIIREKHRIGLDVFADSIMRAVKKSGGGGRVRSLILVGLETEEKTLEGVEFLARLGCDPVLSPFRPSIGTKLSVIPPPSMALLERVIEKSLEIAGKYGVKLGPRCIPCQHNTLTFPDTSGAYYYSKSQVEIQHGEHTEGTDKQDQ